MKFFLILLFLAVFTGAAGNTFATEDEQYAEAISLFEAGITFFEANNFKESLVSFESAYRLRPNWKILFNIGQCQAALKQYGRALDSFEQYLVEGGDAVLPERQNEVQKEIDRLHRLCGELTIIAPNGASIHIDNRDVGSAPLPGPVRIAAGVHTVRVIDSNMTLLEKEVRITGKGQRIVRAERKVVVNTEKPVLQTQPEPQPVVVPQKESAATPPVTPKIGHQTTRGKRIGIALLAGGGTLLVASIVTGSIALSTEKKLEEKCPNHRCTSSSDLSLKDRANALKITTDVLWPVGVTLAGIGAIILAKALLRKDTIHSKVNGLPLVRLQFDGCGLRGEF